LLTLGLSAQEGGAIAKLNKTTSRTSKTLTSFMGYLLLTNSQYFGS
jgi:hypothetical protein